MKTPIIRTVKRDIAPQSLGWCQCHEHLFVADGPSRCVDGALYMNDMEKSLAEAKRYHAAGGRALVDAQPYGCGRMAENLIEVSRASGVHIIASTGFHKIIFMEDKESFTAQSAESIARVYRSEIEEGMYGRDGGRLPARAGLIKCAAVPGWISDGIYHKLFEAAAHAARETGAPVMVHMDPGTDALDVIRFFTDRGIKPGRLILCHLDRVRYDLLYHTEVAATRAYLEYDTIRRFRYHSDEKEAALIGLMVSRGYAESLLLGLDTTNKRLKSYGADFGLDYILTGFVGELAQCGVDSDMLDTIMVQNPQNALAVKKG